ncbi:MAG: hypothetical protein PHS51_13730 [Gallionella sp.]|nr:hypothetical protein [Gallionella sp.]
MRFIDNDKIIVSNANGRVLLVDIKSGLVVQKFEVHDLNATSVAPLPDGKYILTASHDRSIHLVSIADSRTLVTFYDPPRADVSDGPLLKGNEFLSIDSAGFYSASRGAERQAVVKIGGELYPIKDLRSNYFRPKRIAKELSNR